MRRVFKILFWSYVAFDLFIGYAGILPLSLLAGAQGPEPFPPVQLVTNKLWVVPAQPNPQQVPSANIALSGNPGPQTYFYWIVSRYLVGNSPPAGPFVILNAANPLSASTFDVVNWTAVSDAGVTYDVLRTTTPLMPSGVCNCAVATNVTSPVNDQSNALGAYTVNTIDPNTLNLTMTSEVQGAGSTHLILRLKGVQVSDLSVAGIPGTTINPTNNVIPVRTNATTFGDSNLTNAPGSVTNSQPYLAPNGGVCANAAISFTNGTNSGLSFNANNGGQMFLCGGGFDALAISGSNGVTSPSNGGYLFANGTNLTGAGVVVDAALYRSGNGVICAGADNTATCNGFVGLSAGTSANNSVQRAGTAGLGFHFDGTNGIIFSQGGADQAEINSSTGIILPNGNFFGWCANTTIAGCANQTSFTQVGVATVSLGTNGNSVGTVFLGGIQSRGNTFTASGCTNSALTGGATAGSFVVGQNTACTIVLTVGTGVPGSLHGWTCPAYDETAVPAVAIRQTTHSSTSCSLLMTVATNDVIVFSMDPGW